MKRIIITLLVALATYITTEAQVVIYSLPSTTIHLEVEAINESFTPGPYCKYAKKYLGIEVPQEAVTTHQLVSIKMTPLIEADREYSYVLNLEGFEGKTAASNFFNLTSQGLIILSDENRGKAETWRFPSLADTYRLNASEATENLTSAETTLYRNVKNAKGGYDKVAMKQSQVVEKSPESKAKEAASMIFSIRMKRMDIVTGNTDATYSGEALKSAIDELSKMEEEFMTLFTGSSETAIQKENFDIVPSISKEDEMKIAFRISDKEGLIPADKMAGKPIVMEIIPEQSENDISQDIAMPINKQSEKMVNKASKRGNIYYRIPSICKINILDGESILLQSRVPVYQKGETLSFPVSVLIN